MSLAELGKCEEAANLTKQLITKSEKEKNPDLTGKLKKELKHYQTEKPCRVSGKN
jgi:predicted oxidoreductase